MHTSVCVCDGEKGTDIYLLTWSECRMEKREEEFPMQFGVHLGSKESIYKKPGRKLGKKGRLSSGPGSGVKLFLP